MDLSDEDRAAGSAIPDGDIVEARSEHDERATAIETAQAVLGRGVRPLSYMIDE